MPKDLHTDPRNPADTRNTDATATFDKSDGTDRASSEALNSATDVKGERDPVSRPDSDKKPAI